MKKRKSLWISLSVVFVVLIITNPSLSRYREYGSPSASKPYNLFVFSIFKDGDKMYLGILSNFFCVKTPAPEQTLDFADAKDETVNAVSINTREIRNIDDYVLRNPSDRDKLDKIVDILLADHTPDATIQDIVNKFKETHPLTHKK